MATVNENDPRLQEIKVQEQEAKNQSNELYNQMINSSDSYYQSQIENSKEWAEKQQELQQANTDFAIEKIEQQKQQAQKDYTREQKASYQDYMKQNNAYGSQNQALGQRGLGSSGWSETVQAGYYNSYQNRIATARESFNNIILDYNNGIKEAQLANNSALAQIAYDAQQKQLELSLQGFQYKNNLLLQKEEAQRSIDQDYSNRWNTVWNQLMEEAKSQEEYERWKQEIAIQWRQLELMIEKQTMERQQWEAEYSLKQRELSMQEQAYSFSNGGGYAVNTAYYQGDINPDANIYGTFSNGYQPKGISGHGTLTKSGQTFVLHTQTLSGQKQELTQNVWKAQDGTHWYWDGRYNQYKRAF